MSYNEERFIGVSTEKNATVVPRLIWSGFGLSESGLTFLLSLASASFGVTKFIKAGPASIVRNDKWLDGFGTLTFMLIYLNVSCILFTKGLIIGRLVDLIQRSKISSLNNLLIFIVFLPQCLHVSNIVLLTGLQLYQHIIAGIWHSLLLSWHQEGYEHNYKPPCPSADTRLLLLDIWPSEGQWMLCL